MDFASLGQPTTVHRPAEQVFTLEENDDQEDMVAMMEQSQWTSRGTTEPNIPPSLQQMFALARQMGYEMRPIARCTGNTRQAPSSPRTTGQGYRAPFRQGRDYSKVKCFSCGHIWDTHRPGAPNRTHHFPSGRMVGTHSLMVRDNTLMDHNRKRHIDQDLTHTGLHAIHLDPISSSSSTSNNSSGLLNLPTVNHSTTGNSVQFVDRDVTASTSASLVRSTDSSPTHYREVTHDTEQTSTGLQTNHPVITHLEQVDDSVMQISGTGH